MYEKYRKWAVSLRGNKFRAVTAMNAAVLIPCCLAVAGVLAVASVVKTAYASAGDELLWLWLETKEILRDVTKAFKQGAPV